MPSDPQTIWDVVVIGAGPAGLMAAAGAAGRGLRTLLLEKSSKAGVKILMSGGTRCNLTQSTDARGICDAFGTQGRFLRAAVGAFGPNQLVDLVEGEGVPTKVEPTGKIFPASDRALDVQEALLKRLRRSKCWLALGEPVLTLETAVEGFLVGTDQRRMIARKVVLTTGGQSYPGCGTTGDGYRFAAALGHTIVRPRVALVPVTTAADWIPPLKGLTIPDVRVKVLELPEAVGAAPTPPVVGRPGSPPSVLADDRGSFLFTHFGLSGPAVLNVSRAVSGHGDRKRLLLECDFLPAMNDPQCADDLQRRLSSLGKRQLLSVLAEMAPQRLAETFCTLSGIGPQLRAAEVPKPGRQQLLAWLKHAPVRVTGTLGFEKAEVTAGGVALDEVDPRTMHSRRVPGLYLAGEVLDIDGPIGGYNFQAAFSTGYLAGQSV